VSRATVMLDARASKLLADAALRTGRTRAALASEAIAVALGGARPADPAVNLQDLAQRLGDALPNIDVIAVRLGHARAVDTDHQLGDRTRVGFDPGMTPAELGWATAGYWVVRPATYLAGIAEGRVQVLLRTALTGWKRQGNRIFHSRPVLISRDPRDHAIDLASDCEADLTPDDVEILNILSGVRIDLPRGGRNPVRRLTTDTMR